MPAVATTVRSLYRSGVSPHAIHRHVRRALGARAPSRAAVYRHLHGDRLYRPCLDANDREQHEFARRQRGAHPLVGAAAESAALGRLVPRGSAAFVAQVAQWLFQHGLVPRPAFEQLGIDGSAARRVNDPVYRAAQADSASRDVLPGRLAHVGPYPPGRVGRR